jgi:hypothetical protein
VRLRREPWSEEEQKEGCADRDRTNAPQYAMAVGGNPRTGGGNESLKCAYHRFIGCVVPWVSFIERIRL